MIWDTLGLMGIHVRKRKGERRSVDEHGVYEIRLGHTILYE